jgi:molecular chaperone DnaK
MKMKKVIGIDLGTTNSVIGFKTKTVEILRNKENEELTRSCVGQKEVDSEILVGRSAFGLLKRSPENTILSVKRLMGVGYQDEMTQKMIAETHKTRGYYKYTITQLQGGTDNAVAVLLQGKQYSPEQISGEILKKLKRDAEYRLGDEVTHAVITVPAYFTDKQKNATKLAAKYAGLKVQKLLAEPTAAAIAYGVDEIAEGEAKTVLIYDFGGGTFDLSVLNIVDGQYLEMGTGGDRWLGGDDIDKALSDYIYERTCEEHGIEISNIDGLIENLSSKQKFRFLSDFREKVEEVKISLSASKSCDFILEDILEDEHGDVMDINLTITRQEFEKLIRPFIQRSIDLIDELISSMNYDMDMIDNILLVGGTSCIPLVKEMLVAKYGHEKIKVSKRPMLAIAEGAAILAHRLDDSYEEAEGDTSKIEEVTFTTSHDYFIKLNVDGEEKREKVIEKQMPIPTIATKTYSTTSNNQRLIAIEIENDVENGGYERVALGFYLIEHDLPINSSFVFEFKAGLNNNDDMVEVSVYPQGEKHKSKAIILGRDGADEKALNTLNGLVQRAIKETRTLDAEQEAIALVAEKVKEIDRIGAEKMTGEDWGRVRYTVEEEYQTIIKNQGEGNSGKDTVLYYAKRLLGEFNSMINPADVQVIVTLITQIETDNHPNEEHLVLQLAQKVMSDYGRLNDALDIPSFADRILDLPSTSVGDAARKEQDVQKLQNMARQIKSKFLSNQAGEAIQMLEMAEQIMNVYKQRM